MTYCDQQTRYCLLDEDRARPSPWIKVSSVSSEPLISSELKSSVAGGVMLAISIFGVAETMVDPPLTANEVAEMATSVSSTATEHVGYIPGWHGLQKVELRAEAPSPGLVFEVHRST